MYVTKPIPLAQVRISGGFWRDRIDNVAGEVIPYQWRALNDQIPEAEPSHAIENFRIAAGDSHGKFYGLIFQDSDVGKWIEAAAYSLIDTPNPDVEKIIDEAVDLIGRTQEGDGYLGTYFKMTSPEKKWTDLAMGHEMYCGGHLIEGAVAYFRATGKRAFLDIMVRYADHLDRRFGRGPGKEIGYCGHPEIELALFKLYEATGEARYRDLARFFVDERGRHPEVLDNSRVIDWGGGGPAFNRWHQKDYYLDHEQVRNQVHADGHSVRAMYLYAAMADQWRLTGDQTLGVALERLWENATNRRMYVTGGLGSQATCERFTVDYDLPPDTAYAETCAAIGLVFWAWRMTQAEPRRKYADILERALYNGALSGISLDGKRYFYVNPLAVVPEVAAFRKDHDHVKAERVQWLGCACCPPNIARLICSIGQFLYTVDERGVWIHQYAPSSAELPVPGGRAKIHQETSYPWAGEVLLRIPETVPGARWALRFRVPEYAGEARAWINGAEAPCRENGSGYVELERVWEAGDELKVSFDLPARVVRPHPRLREAAGLVAVQRGPLVYCAEEADNGKDLHQLRLKIDEPMDVEPAPGLPSGVRAIVASGVRRTEADGAPLYAADKEKTEVCRIRLVPYFAWGNRGAGEMRVWLQDGGSRGD